MPRHHVHLTPYFRSDAFQNSDERKMEKAIEEKCKSVLCFITKIWKHSPTPLEKAIEKIKIEDKELFDRLKDQ